MTDETLMIEALEARSKRREGRRDFFRSVGGAAATLGGVMALAGQAAPVHAQAAPSDEDILNFALNLEYLEAQFYFAASFGEGLPQDLLDGTGEQGASVGGRRVNFTDRAVAQYAREIALDERAHVEFLRTALGSAAVAQPQIDISANQSGAFSAAARSAGLIGANESFDPYASDENFLLAAYIFEDVGVTAYKGAAPLITSATFLEAAAGILAVEAYHAGLIRTTLYRKGLQAPVLRDATVAISNARDSLDGPENRDQGVFLRADGQSNIVPVDVNGIAYSRTAGEVLNIAYLNRMAVDRGGFFPEGVNGAITTSDAN